MSEQDRTEHDGRADFDFFIGRWKQQHRRLRERLKGSNDWEEAGGMLVVRKILGGLGNLEEGTLERESGVVHVMTVRLFDPHTREWSLYWADGVNGWNWSSQDLAQKSGEMRRRQVAPRERRGYNPREE